MFIINTDVLSYDLVNSSGEILNFPLKIINKRNINFENQCTLINAYIDYKGSAWFDTLFDLLKELHSDITYTSSSRMLEEVPLFQTIVDYFDMQDIETWLVNIKKIKVPKGLISSFTDEIKNDGRWTEDQTYTVDDYIRLAAETIRLKFLLGPLNYYYYINSNKFNPVLVEFTLVRMHLSKLLDKSLAIDKVTALVTRLVASVDKQSVVIDKKLSDHELANYVTYIATLQRIATATIVDDTEDKNIIKFIYGYCNSKLTTSGDVSKMIRPKIPVAAEENGSNDTASVLEAYKAVTLTTPGDVEEVLWVTESIASILKNSPDYIVNNVNVVRVNKNKDSIAQIYADASISSFTTRICELIFGNTINQKAVNSLTLENMINLIVIGHDFLHSLGYENLANILISKSIEFKEITYTTRNKKDKILFNKLELIYFGKGEAYVDILVDELLSTNWINYTGPVSIGPNIINDIAEVMILTAENLYQ